MREGYIPQNERKKILLLSDDLRFPSGVGVMSKELVVKTAHRFNWVQVAAAMKHPEQGRVMDASQALGEEIGISDASLKLYPYNGYGDPGLIRTLLQIEKPDAILHFTDPRYWIWLYQMEHELREHIPILYYHVWDDLPFPKYNKPYYQSCDEIYSISKQTHNIVRQVSPETSVKYVPHGVDETIFHKVTGDEGAERLTKLKKSIFGEDEVDFVLLYNSRNIRRKMTGDIILAFRKFFLELPEEKRKRTRLLLHTAPVDENGTDLPTLIRDCAPEISVVFSAGRLEPNELNDLYNLSDVVINLSSAEGFGLGTLEAIMSERLIIVNVTGGLQDQCGFTDEDGKLLTVDEHYNSDWGSNHDGRYKTHGEWALPVYPTSLGLIGSPPTPYIFDDRCSYLDATKRLHEVYEMSREERERRGALGREFALSQGMTAEIMANTMATHITNTLASWKPRKRFELIKA
jgi:glycosyltransferase involved in cell wall biosynthesis